LLGAGAAPSPAAPGRASPAGCCGVGAGAACAPVAGAAGAGDRNGCSGGGSGGGGGSAPRSHAGAAGRAEGPAPAGSTARSAAAGGVAAGGSGCSQGAGRGGGGGCGSASPKLAPWPGPGAPPRLAVRSCTTAPGSGGALLGPSPQKGERRLCWGSWFNTRVREYISTVCVRQSLTSNLNTGARVCALVSAACLHSVRITAQLHMIEFRQLVVETGRDQPAR